MLYSNKIESFYVKNFMKEYRKMPRKEAWLALIQGLDTKSIDVLSKCLTRMDLVEKKKYIPLDLFTEEEKERWIDVKQNFFENILSFGNDCYCYQHYLLPVRNFEIDVFYDKYGMELLHSPDKLVDKDIIDAGAYIGDSALFLQEYTTQKVYAFEPEDDNYNSLLRTIQLNDSSRIIPEKLALGEKKGKKRISKEGMASSMRCISKSKAFQTVQAITIDQYVRENNLNVGLIKLDVEGFEQKVLHGALKTIKSQKPILLVSIYHNANDFFRIKPWIDSLNLGYSFKIFKPTNTAILCGTLLIAEAINGIQ